MKTEIRLLLEEVNSSQEETIAISNLRDSIIAKPKYIRDQMARYTADTENKLQTAESENYSNYYSISIGFVRNKMILG